MILQDQWLNELEAAIDETLRLARIERNLLGTCHSAEYAADSVKADKDILAAYRSEARRQADRADGWGLVVPDMSTLEVLKGMLLVRAAAYHIALPTE